MLINLQNAPTNLDELAKLSPAILYRMALQGKLFNGDEAAEQAFVHSPQPDKAQQVLDLILRFQQNPQAAAVHAIAPPGAPDPNQAPQGASAPMTQSNFPGQVPPPPGAYPQQQPLQYGAPQGAPQGAPPPPPPGSYAPPQPQYGAPQGAPQGYAPPQQQGYPQQAPQGYAQPQVPQGPPGYGAPPQGYPPPQQQPQQPQQPQYQAPPPPAGGGWTPPGAAPQGPPQGAPQGAPSGYPPPPGAPQGAPMAGPSGYPPPPGVPAATGFPAGPPRQPQTASDPGNAGAAGQLLTAIEKLAGELQQQNQLLSGITTLVESNFIASVVIAERMQIPRDQLSGIIAAERANIRAQFFTQGK